jgi:hypothetical protein
MDSRTLTAEGTQNLQTYFKPMDADMVCVYQIAEGRRNDVIYLTRQEAEALITVLVAWFQEAARESSDSR